MAIPNTGWYEIFADNQAGASTVALPPISIPANSNIRAHAMMLQAGHGVQSNLWATDVYVSKYVQDGVEKPGPARFLLGHNITQIFLQADVVNSAVRGGLLIEYF